MFIETSSPRKNGDNAILLSQQQSGVKCLSFWYHMYGPHIDRLMISTLSNNKKGATLWQKIGTQGNQWINSNVTINGNKSMTNYQVSNLFVVAQLLLHYINFVYFRKWKLVKGILFFWYVVEDEKLCQNVLYLMPKFPLHQKLWALKDAYNSPLDTYLFHFYGRIPLMKTP